MPTSCAPSIDGLVVDCVKRLGSTAIAITHDMASARRIEDAAAMIHRGKIIWSGPTTSNLMDSGNPIVDQFTHGRRRRADPDGAAAIIPHASAWGCWLLAPTAYAATADSATQLAGLFMQSCVPFAGDHTALRDWAHQLGLAEVPEPARAAFLHGAPGMVFDASNPAGKFVVISDDAGGCSVLAATANGPDVLKALEDDLHQAGISLHTRRGHRRSKSKRICGISTTPPPSAHGNGEIVAGTVRDQQGGRAMLTANPD